MIRPAAWAFLPALTLAAAAADPSAAQTAITDMLEVFDGSGDSLSNILLSRIFGCRLFPAGTDCDSLPAPAFGAVIGLFNLFIVALGMALFAWNLTVGTMQTAHEGQVLGANWNSMWAPIRTVTAVAMLSPLPAADNYNAVQLSVAWLVRGSTSAASIVWARGSSLILNHQAPITAPGIVFDQEVLRAAWRLASCQAVFQHVVNSHSDPAGRIDLRPRYREVAGRASPTEGMMSPDDLALQGPRRQRVLREMGTGAVPADADFAFGTCGTISLPAPPEVVLTAGQGPAWYAAQRAAVEAAVSGLRTAAGRLLEEELARPGRTDGPEVLNAARAILDAGAEYHGILARRLPGIAEASAIPLGGSRGLTGAARQRIDLIIGGAFSGTCAERGGRADDALNWICGQAGAGQGWLGAGAWYMHMARLAGEASALYNARPEVVDPPDFRTVLFEAGEWTDTRPMWRRLWTRRDSNDVLAGAARIERRLDTQWNAAVIRAAGSGSRIDGRLIEGAFVSEGVNHEIGGWWEAARDWMSTKARDWFLPPAHVDPMAALVEFGNAQLAWGLGLAGIGKVAQSSLADVLPLGQLAKSLGDMSQVIGIALLTTGAFLAFILPMMPFLLWTMAVTGYFILVAEAIMAVSLWGIAHLRMDGQSFAGEAARQGYYLVLALVLSPILMVFGFILGMGIFKVTSTLLGIGFDAAIRGIAHDQSWAVWFVGMAVVGIMMVIIYAVLAERSFSLTVELPTRILRWVGANAELGSREDDRVRAGALAAAGIITSAGRDALNSGGRLLQGPRGRQRVPDGGRQQPGQ